MKKKKDRREWRSVDEKGNESQPNIIKGGRGSMEIKEYILRHCDVVVVQ